MKCIICSTCGEYIKRGEAVFAVDSVFENEVLHVCKKCSELYSDYPESIKQLDDDTYNTLNWFDVITSRWDYEK